MSIARTLALLGLAVAPPALGYRPFDQTDADVAGKGRVELELGPVGIVHAAGRTEYTPRLVANFGFAPATEVVLEAVDHLAVGETAGPRFSVTGIQLSLKRVLREGTLQEASGPSVALECGVLLPGIHDEDGFGGTCSGIASLHAGPLLLHFNAALALERNGNLVAEPGLIAEGPERWPVRPVAEALWVHEWGGGNAATLLAGAIWRVGEGLSVDGAVRGGRSEGTSLFELRAGFTWGF